MARNKKNNKQNKQQQQQSTIDKLTNRLARLETRPRPVRPAPPPPRGRNRAEMVQAAERAGTAAIQQQQQLNIHGLAPARHNVLRQRLLRILGSSVDASAFVMKTIHPMDEVIGQGSFKIPDTTTGATVSPEGRFQISIPAPGGLTNGQTWDADVWIPNSIDVPLVYRTYVSGSQPTTIDTWTCPKVPAFPYGDFTLGNGKINTYPKLSNLVDNHRGVYKGVTMHLIANALNDSGVVYAGQWADSPAATVEAVDPLEADTVIPGLQYSFQPVTEDALYQKQPGTVSWEARRGVYMPLKYMQPVHDLVPAATPGFIATRTPAGVPDYLKTSPGLNVGNFVATAGHCNFQSGMILFRGLNAGATLRLKFKEGIEATPQANSDWTPYVEASPLYDPKAMATQVQLAQRMELGFPADYNDDSNILGSIWSWVRGAVKAVGGMSVPIVSDIARVVDGSIDAINDIVR